MVVVVMRDQNHVDGRQVLEGNAGLVDPLRPGKGERACPLRVDRIGQKVEPRDLNQDGRVPHQGHPQPVDLGGRLVPERARELLRPGCAPTPELPAQEFGQSLVLWLYGREEPPPVKWSVSGP